MQSLKKQRIEDTRARLIFSIKSWEGMYLLCITNIGKETAFNINLKIEGDPIKYCLSKWEEKMWEYVTTHPFSITASNSTYLFLSPTEKQKGGHYVFCNPYENIEFTKINDWLNKYLESPIRISGDYCNGKYKIDEILYISDENLYGMIVQDPITLELNNLNKKFSKLIEDLQAFKADR